MYVRRANKATYCWFCVIVKALKCEASQLHYYQDELWYALLSKFNYSQIATHSREQGDSMRRKDDRRKQQRDKQAANRVESKSKKDEELKRLKNMKKSEIFGKLKTIQSITGNTSVGFGEIDLDQDFDPGIPKLLRGYLFVPILHWQGEVYAIVFHYGPFPHLCECYRGVGQTHVAGL